MVNKKEKHLKRGCRNSLDSYHTLITYSSIKMCLTAVVNEISALNIAHLKIYFNCLLFLHLAIGKNKQKREHVSNIFSPWVYNSKQITIILPRTVLRNSHFIYFAQILLRIITATESQGHAMI